MQRLKHMVQDKMHARARGPMQFLTRQPVEGRSRMGGLRVGEMEKDNLVAHGATSILQDRLLDQSDAYDTFVCEECGQLADPAAPKNKGAPLTVTHARPYCRYCVTGDHVRPVRIPYAMKLLMQEIQATHVDLRLELEPRNLGT